MRNIFKKLALLSFFVSSLGLQTPVYAEGLTVNSNETITYTVTAEIPNNSTNSLDGITVIEDPLPTELEIGHFNLFTSKISQNETLVVEVCNTSENDFLGSDYGKLNLNVTIGAESDSLYFSGDIPAGGCKDFARSNLLSTKYNFSDLTSGLYMLTVSIETVTTISATETPKESASRQIYIQVRS